MGLVLELRVEEPTSIEELANQMQEAANVLGFPLEAIYQGVRLRAVFRGLASEIVRTYEIATAATSPVERFATSVGGEEPANPVPGAVSDRQFAQAAAELGVLTWPEAEGWGATGEIPATLLAAIDAIPDRGTQARARMFVRSATTFHRDHPMTGALAQALGWTDAQLDDLFRLAAVL